MEGVSSRQELQSKNLFCAETVGIVEHDCGAVGSGVKEARRKCGADIYRLTSDI